MSSRRSRSYDRRAEARRRARYAAQGREPLPEDDAPPAESAQPARARPPGGLFARLFPAAPPLPGKPDPLAGFAYTGRGRGLVSGAWLLIRHPLPWGAPAAGWAILQLMLLLVARQNVLAFAITLGQYVLLIAAGWVGWWRPWLFGTAAGVAGVLLQAVIAAVITLQAGESFEAALAVVTSLAALVALYGLVGAFAGFYGGYLRRRMATPTPPVRYRRR